MSVVTEKVEQRALDIATMIIVREYFGVDTSANDIAVDAYVSCEALATDIIAAVAPLIAAQERERAVVAAASALDAYGKWNGEITPERLMKPITAAIRALD